jgi:hypothetical protein
MPVNKRFLPVVLPLLALAACLSAVAGDVPDEGRPPRVAGRWEVSWQARLGTEQAIVELEQDGSKLRGTFHDPRHSCLLSGAIEGRNISFNVDFQGSRPYTIAFKGIVDGDKISGTSQAKNIGGTGAYLGHGGEIVQPEHPWTATRPVDPPSLQTQKAKAGTPSNSN